MAQDLVDVSTDDLLAEVQRRMHCMDKPEKRVIMVGENECLLRTLCHEDRWRHTSSLTLLDQHRLLLYVRTSGQWKGHTVPEIEEGALSLPSCDR